MSSSADQQAAVERLYENEAIIDNLTSDVAQPLLGWAEQQILAGAAPDAVVAAVQAANQSGAQEATAALAEAQRSLDAAGGAAPASATSALAPDQRVFVETQAAAQSGASAAPVAPPEPARPADPQTTAQGAAQRPSRRRRRPSTSARRKRA